MRPEILFPLFAPVTGLPGIGPRLGQLIGKLAGPSVADLLWHLPSGIVDRRYRPSLETAEPGRLATVTVEVVGHRSGGQGKPWRVEARDGTGRIEFVFFHGAGGRLQQLLPVGGQVTVSGKLDSYGGRLQMTHPDTIVPAGDEDGFQAVEPVYPLTAGLVPKTLRKAVEAALQRLPALPEWLDPALLAREGWPGFDAALRSAHAPQEAEDLEPLTPARLRLAYDELLSAQLALALIRQAQQQRGGRALLGTGLLRARLLAQLPWPLTAAQSQAIAEIDADLAAPRPMLRLLQGDVGSGKTMVALAALVTAVEAGTQGALMVPTEILAQQHLATLTPLAETLGLRLALLSGRIKGRARDAILGDLAEGRIDILIGTHALFQKDVAFRDLGLAVIDEQHRFGVHQRLELQEKNARTDVLVMTATPIPRTLLLTGYGDMAVSRLREKPPGRQPIDTRIVSADRIDDVVEGLRRTVAGGARAYWICPLVEENDELDITAATARHAALSEALGPRVGLVHGKMPAAAKDAVMEAFAAGELDVLVATTVVEVGVDVPAATAMVIEHAERFGLAQLHQLRGRVGRGSGRSSCLLVYAHPLSETARRRLETMRGTEDGFLIAEEDLALRGAGDVLGVRQSGLPAYRLARLPEQTDLLETARRDAQHILSQDPELSSPRGEALRVLLYLFAQDAAVRRLRSG